MNKTEWRQLSLNDSFDKLENYVEQALNSGVSQAAIKGQLLAVGVATQIYWGDFDGDLKLDGVLLTNYLLGEDPYSQSNTTIVIIRCQNGRYELERGDANQNVVTGYQLVAITDFHHDGNEQMVFQGLWYSLSGTCEIDMRVVALSSSKVKVLSPTRNLARCPGGVSVEDVNADGIKEVVVFGKDGRQSDEASVVQIYEVGSGGSLVLKSTSP